MDDGGNALAACFTGIIPLMMAVVFYIYYGYFEYVSELTPTDRDDGSGVLHLLRLLFQCYRSENRDIR